jgi:hypothetical protein
MRISLPATAVILLVLAACQGRAPGEDANPAPTSGSHQPEQGSPYTTDAQDTRVGEGSPEDSAKAPEQETPDTPDHDQQTVEEPGQKR